MDDHDLEWSAERTAATVAPHLDRIRIGMVSRIRPQLGELAAANGLDMNAGQTIGLLRNLMPDRSASRDAVLQVFRYQPTDVTNAGIDGCIAAGVLDESGAGEITLTEKGRQSVRDVLSSLGHEVDVAWEPCRDLVGDVLPLVERVSDAAADTGGPAYSVMAPIWRSPDMSPAIVLCELLTPLRFHRFDAHIAAWTAAGLTVDEITALAPGPERDAIERETNRLAAPPYAVLSPSERASLAEGLAQLPA